MKNPSAKIVSGEEIKRMVEAGELKSGPIRHRTLAPDLLKKIQMSFDVVGPFLGMNLEQYEVGFMRDSHPDREINIWLGISLALAKFSEGKKPLSKKLGTNIIGALIQLSSGIRDPKYLQSVSPKVAGELLRIWNDLEKQYEQE